jgi:hypothetical protein
MTPQANILIRGFFLILAFLCVGFSGRQFYIDHMFDTSAATATARIVSGSISNPFFHAGSSFVKYTFTLPDGRTFENSQGLYSGNPGDTIQIEYVHPSPELNRVAGSGSREHRLVWIFGVPAALFLLIALRLRL